MTGLLLTCGDQSRMMGRVNSEDDADILNKIGSDPERVLAILYRKHKHMFMGYLRKIGGDADVHADVYHDALLAFYDIWTEGRYDPTRASVSTLLCAIGRNKLLTRLGRQKRDLEYTELTDAVSVMSDNQEDVSESLIRQVQAALDNLGDGCRQIIALYYYHRCQIKEIAELMQYKNENVVKAHKSRCMKRLKEMINRQAHE